MSPWILDVLDPDFETEVVQRSHETPVVVDFWAPWCGPCRSLGPVLEKLTEEHAGAFVLVRVNVDDAPASAGRCNARSIPTVLGFRDGAVVAEFVGAQPESAVRDFLLRLLPSEADLAAARGDAAAAAGEIEQARAEYRDALTARRDHPRAHLGCARLFAEAGEIESALASLEEAARGSPLQPEIDELAARLRVGRSGGQDLAALSRAFEANPQDPEAGLALGCALAAEARSEEAFAPLLASVAADPEHAQQAARRTLLDLFALLGDDHEATRSARRQLAQALYR